jgi:hypothetical protein
MAKKTRRNAVPAKPALKAKATEFEFWIDAFTPKTIPMARLAEYMGELATMLGEQASVHFVKLKPGSTRIVHRINTEAVPKVHERAREIKRGEAPRDALRAYENVNKMLRDDNGTGAWKDEQTEAVIILFPGIKSEEEKFSAIRERGTIDGEVIRVGGPHKWVPILIQTDGEPFSGCWADRTIAKQLAQRIFEQVRLHGTGKWDRTGDGKWVLKEFLIERFDPLSGDTLSEALGRIRAIKAFKESTIDDLDYLRNGPPEKQNGGH